MPNILEEYLNKIGFEIDEPAYRKLQSVMGDVERTVTAHTSGMAKHILEAQGAIVGAFTSISAAIVGTVDKVAMADQSYRLMGLRMLMTTDSARKLDLITKSLGADLPQIVWDRELHERAVMMSDDIDRMTAALGPDFEKKMHGIRDIRFEFSRLQVAVKFLAMSFTEKLFDKLMPGDVQDKIKRFVDWFESKIPELADKLSTYAVPALKATWGMIQMMGRVLEEAGVIFTNFVGLLSGDTSIEGASFSFDKMAKAIEHVGSWMERLFGWIAHAEELLAHFTAALALSFEGKFGEAASEFKAGLKDLTGGSGLVLGATAGAGAGGLAGALYGGIAGATAGSVVPGIGTIAGGVGGATLGLIGGGVGGGALGGGLGKLREWLMPSETPATPPPAALPATIVRPPATLATPEEEPRVITYSVPRPETESRALPPVLAPPAPLIVDRRGESRRDLTTAIEAAADKYGVPRSLALAIATQESGIRQDRESKKGAIGIMQLMPATAKDLKVDPNDAYQNIEGGVHYLSQLLKHYHGDTSKAIAAYNAGMGRVDKTPSAQLPSETRTYVPSVKRLQRYYDAEAAQAVIPKTPAREAAAFSIPEKYAAPATGPATLPSINLAPNFDFGSVLTDMQRPVAPQVSTNNAHATLNVDVGGIFVTQPGADEHTIRAAVQSGVQDALKSQVQFDLAQLSPAWG